MSTDYDLVVIGAGSGGLTAAGFAARLGARVALIEKDRIGGDCTWTGCVPSKALLKAAKVAHETRTAARYGIDVGPAAVDMARVREYVRGAIRDVYRLEEPEELRRRGIEVIPGEARFVDNDSVAVDGHSLRSKAFLIATGAKPAAPEIAGIEDVPYLTYEQIFEVDRLPQRMTVVGGGPIGTEIAQAYQRLGSQVTMIARELLPKEEPAARQVLERVFAREGIQLVRGRALAARLEGRESVVVTDNGEVRGDLLLVAAGRKPNVNGLGLESTDVAFTAAGITVDAQLRTTVKHIYAAGDVLGGAQFTHFAGWQAFQAVRNALLPGHAAGFTEVVPRVTFTDPEVACVGPTEAEAREKFGDSLKVCLWGMDHTDRAVCEGDTDGFIQLLVKDDGVIVGATIVAARAGEAITELVHAVQHKWKAGDLAGVIHAYPTYSTGVQQLAADLAIENLISGTSGRLLLGFAKLIR
jgi:pyruvate/2-oxoglutarate dehydrogenase complex dihydrolipoamide dehydrogenase (E3) component